MIQKYAQDTVTPEHHLLQLKVHELVSVSEQGSQDRKTYLNVMRLVSVTPSGDNMNANLTKAT